MLQYQPARSRWAKQCGSVDWNSLIPIVVHPARTCKESELYNSLLARKLPVNAYLKTTDRNSHKCCHCCQDETIEHFVFDCPVAQKFWIRASLLLSDLLEISIEISIADIVYSFNNLLKLDQVNLILTFHSVALSCLWTCRKSGNDPWSLFTSLLDERLRSSHKLFDTDSSSVSDASIDSEIKKSQNSKLQQQLYKISKHATRYESTSPTDSEYLSNSSQNDGTLFETPLLEEIPIDYKPLSNEIVKQIDKDKNYKALAIEEVEYKPLTFDNGKPFATIERPLLNDRPLGVENPLFNGSESPLLNGAENRVEEMEKLDSILESEFKDEKVIPGIKSRSRYTKSRPDRSRRIGARPNRKKLIDEFAFGEPEILFPEDPKVTEKYDRDVDDLLLCYDSQFRPEMFKHLS